MDDSELAAGLIKNDPTAQLELIARFSERLVEQLQRKFEILDDAQLQDIAHDAIYKLIFEPRHIDLTKGDLGGLLYTIAYRKALDHVRSYKRALSKRRVSSYDDLCELVDEADPPADLQSPDIADDFVLSNDSVIHYPDEVLQAARAVLAKFDNSERDVEHIRLRLQAKLRPVEIANLLKLSANEERVRWHRLKRQLNTELSKHSVLAEFARQFSSKNQVALLTVARTPKEDKIEKRQ